MDEKTKPKEKDEQAPKAVPQSEEPIVKPEEQIVKDEEESFDFGGLPQRDLKKNLGCG